MDVGGAFGKLSCDDQTRLCGYVTNSNPLVNLRLELDWAQTGIELASGSILLQRTTATVHTQVAAGNFSGASCAFLLPIHLSVMATNGNYYQAFEILEEGYLVRWAGIDPDTRAPWEPTWVTKRDCSEELIAQWETNKRTNSQCSETSIGAKEIVTGECH